MKNFSEVIFSIIISVYNVEKYLDKCINSVLEQQFSDYEIILVDDGSKDNSGRICDGYAKKYSNIVVIHKENGGLSDARNTGVKAANGDYILFIDGDDYISSGSLSSIAKTIEEGGFPDVVCLELMKFFDDKTETIAMNDGIDEKVNDLTNESLYNYLADLPKYPASACTKAIKRQLFIDNQLDFEKGILSEDLEWCIRLFLSAKTFKYCPDKYYMYRQARVGSISNTPSEKKTMDTLSTFNKWTKYAFELDDLSQKRMIASYMEYIFRFLIIGHLNINKIERKEYKRQLFNGEWVLGSRKDKISKYIRISYRVLGISLTSFLLMKYLKRRGY